MYYVRRIDKRVNVKKKINLLVYMELGYLNWNFNILINSVCVFFEVMDNCLWDNIFWLRLNLIIKLFKNGKKVLK